MWPLGMASGVLLGTLDERFGGACGPPAAMEELVDAALEEVALEGFDGAPAGCLALPCACRSPT